MQSKAERTLQSEFNLMPEWCTRSRTHKCAQATRARMHTISCVDMLGTTTAKASDNGSMTGYMAMMMAALMMMLTTLMRRLPRGIRQRIERVLEISHTTPVRSPRSSGGN